MLSPTYMSLVDRNRLTEINQRLLARHTTEESLEYRTEQQTLMAKRRAINECTLDELSDLRQQLFEQYQKHAAIGSRQLPLLQSYIQQVEYREMMINLKRVEEPEESDDVKKAKSKPTVSTDANSYSWSAGTTDGNDDF
jgi:septum formation topological specificity factor MinE